jgi:deoxyadenosine/deoxycytidine kinase
MIISIEGNIGCGKSTLLEHLDKTGSYNIVQEDVETWKSEGWLELFYSDIKRFAGTFQLRTQISHMENKSKFVGSKINIVERSPLSNKYIFGKMLLDDGFLHPKEFEIIGQVNQLIGWMPEYVIMLLCDPDVCYQRIKKRGRQGENIPSIDYLVALHNKHLELQKQFEDRVYIIDTTNLSPESVAKECKGMIEDLTS